MPSMSGLMDSVRRIVYGVPSNRARRIQTIRDEVVETVEQESWDWENVENVAGPTRDKLKTGKLPEKGSDIQTYFHQVSKKYYSRGYPLDDIGSAFDAVEGRAVAKQNSRKRDV